MEDDLAVPFLAGLVTAIPALLIALLFALLSLGLFVISIIVIFICLFIAELGGLTVYVILATTKPRQEKC